jgi:hypothetical protein
VIEKVMMMMQGDDWANLSSSISDRVKHGEWINCMNTFKSCMKDHGSATTRRYVRKSSSMTLNEALCGRQPGFYLYIYMTVYIVLFNRTIK